MNDHHTLADLTNRFEYHPPRSEEAKVAHETVRARCLDLADFLASELPPGRERSLAVTKLEECMFWANAAIARNPKADTSTGYGSGSGNAITFGAPPPFAESVQEILRLARHVHSQDASITFSQAVHTAIQTIR